MMYCSSCGTGNQTQATHCSMCGKPLQHHGSFQIHLLIFCLVTGILMILVGIVLNELGALPPYVVHIASSIGSLIIIVSAVVTILEKVFQVSLQGVKLLRIVAASFVTVCLLITIIFWAPLYQFGVSVMTAGVHANATATETVSISSSATQEAYTTATASAIAAYPYPSYLPGKGTLALSDPLSGDAFNWHIWSDDSWGGDCQFINGSLHIKQSKPGKLFSCPNYTTDFSNFAFEVEMKISKGDCGGIIFRADNRESKDYLIDVCQDGDFFFTLYVDHTSTNAKRLVGDSSSAIKQGLNQVNLIAVVANGNAFTFYVNRQKITEVNDSTYSHGHIGLIADNYNNPTEVIYNNAKVWTI